MRILIDIGHPAHVHYFKNFIRIMKENGHVFLISARNRSIIHYLLKKYNLPFYNRGKGKNGIIGKLIYMVYADFLLLKMAFRFKPDLFLSFASPYAAQTAWLMRKPHIVLDDTEHAKFGHLFYKPFSTVFLNPSCFFKKFGKKQVFFNSYMELCYLHPNRFKPNSSILEELGVKENERYVIMRFVSWKASHDIGHSGLTLEMKHKAVKEFSKYAKVFISSEAELPEELKQYQIKITPEKMHDVLAFATLYIGEGATMASECAVLGTPAIYVNSLTAGTLEEQEKYGLISGYRNSDGVLQKAKEFLQIPNLKEEYQSRRMKMLEDKIDVTAFMVWFIENYPENVKIMKENPEYQMRFK